MKRTSGTALPRAAGALAAAILLILALAGSAAAQATTNLALGSRPFSSSDWQQAQGNTSFTADKAFDGNLATRWNSDSGDANGAFVGTRWDTPQTITKIVVRQAFDRIAAFRIQQFDAAKADWVDALSVPADLVTALKGGQANPIFTLRFTPPLTTNGIRVLFDTVTSVPSIFEVEVYNSPVGILRGTVRDDKGAPVAGAVIQAGIDATLTDSSGKYSLSTDAGTFNVTASKPGVFHTQLARSVTLAANQTVALDFALTALAPNLALQAMAVSSSNWQDIDTYNAAKANDGDPATRWNSRSDDQAGSWLEIDWSSPQTFSQVTIRESFDRIRNYTLQRWDAATGNWVDIAANVAVPAVGGNPVLENYFAPAITTTKVRLLNVVVTSTASVFEVEVRNEPTGTIRGVVKEIATGQPVPQAVVSSDRGLTVTADNQGAFSMVVPADDHLLLARAPGYFAGVPFPVTVQSGGTQTVTLTLPATGPDLALGGKTVASSEDPAHPARYLVDGDLNTYWQTAPDKHGGEWVGVLFDQPTKFTAIQLRGVVTTVQDSYLQVLAADGKTWVDLPNTRFNVEFQGKDRDFLFPQGVTTLGVRWFAAVTWGVGDNPGLSELLLFNAPLPQ
jgi:hypothetical protein